MTFTNGHIRTFIRQFIDESFLPSSGVEGYNDSDSFMDKGIIDSTGVLELLEFIEEKFGINVEDDEVIPDNLDSVENLAAFILRNVCSACSATFSDICIVS